MCLVSALLKNINHTFGLMYLPGGLFAILVYIRLSLLGVFAWLVLWEYFSGLRLFGLLLGFVGIVVASVDGLTTHISVIGVSLALLTGICWAAGVIYVKKVSDRVNAFWMVAMQNLIGGFVLLVLGFSLESWHDIIWNVPLTIGVVYGFTFGVPIAYIIYYSLINAGEASTVGVATFLVPIFSVLIGIVFLDEVFTLKLFIGMVLVGVSIILVNIKPETSVERQRISVD